MPAIYVCPKVMVESAARQLRPSHLVTLLDPDDDMPTPDEVAGPNHLRLGMHDITAPAPLHTPPDEQHVRELLAFAEGWKRERPLLIHCWAGISRSTASAFAVACMLATPGREAAIAALLRAQAPEQAADELAAHGGRWLTEGAVTNLFMVRDGQLLTHPANHLILPGITRGFVLELACEQNIVAHEMTFTLDELRAADEIFITGTTTHVTAVTVLDGQPVGSSAVGPITQRLHDALMQRIVATCCQP